MKNREKKEIELGKFIDKVKVVGQDAMNRGRSAEELQEDISKICLLCFKSVEDIDQCDMCYGNTRTDIYNVIKDVGKNAE